MTEKLEKFGELRSIDEHGNNQFTNGFSSIKF